MLTNLSSRSARSQSGAALPKKCTYKLDRFHAQNVYTDGPIAGRLEADSTTPHPTTFVPFYQARAAITVAAFDAAFGTGAHN